MRPGCAWTAWDDDVEYLTARLDEISARPRTRRAATRSRTPRANRRTVTVAMEPDDAGGPAR